MITTEVVPYHLISPNRVAAVYETLELSRPLAVRLDRASTAGVSQFSDEPGSTWGFNPFMSLRKPATEKLLFSNLCSHMTVQFIENKCVDIQIALNKMHEATCSKIRWYQLAQADLSRVLGFAGSDIASLCTISNLTGPLSHPTIGLVADLPQATDHVETVYARPMSVEPLKAVEVDLSDYFTPLSFEWTESDYKAAEAARKFGEEFYADH